MLANIKPAVDALACYEGEKSSTDPELVPLVAERNLRLTINQIRERCPILEEMEEEGHVETVGALAGSCRP